jgi:hypothetical protein
LVDEEDGPGQLDRLVELVGAWVRGFGLLCGGLEQVDQNFGLFICSKLLVDAFLCGLALSAALRHAGNRYFLLADFGSQGIPFGGEGPVPKCLTVVEPARGPPGIVSSGLIVKEHTVAVAGITFVDHVPSESLSLP